MLFSSLFGTHHMYNQKYTDEFLRLKKTRRKRTYIFYDAGLKKYLEFAGDRWPPTPELLTDFIESLQRRGLADGTVASYFRAVRTWINWLARTGKISTNPLKEISQPKPPKARVPKAPAYETTDEVFARLESEIERAIRADRLAAKWRLARDLALMSLMLGTGARVGEVVRLNISDVNLPEMSASIRGTKEHKDREVSFSRRVRGDLHLWLSVRPDVDIPALFLSTWRRRLSTNSVRDIINRHCGDGGVQRFTPHSLRHAFAIRSLQNGGSPADVRDQLGHSSIEVTNIYLIAADDQQKNRIRKMAPR